LSSTRPCIWPQNISFPDSSFAGSLRGELPLLVGLQPDSSSDLPLLREKTDCNERPKDASDRLRGSRKEVLEDDRWNDGPLLTVLSLLDTDGGLLDIRLFFLDADGGDSLEISESFILCRESVE